MISILFVDFETEPINDVVDVLDGAASTDQLLGRLSGVNTGKAFISTGSKLSIKFTSDLANGRRGFKISVRGGKWFSIRDVRSISWKGLIKKHTSTARGGGGAGPNCSSLLNY